MIMIALASDHAGFDLKEHIARYLEKNGLEYKDFGAYDKSRCDYPQYALYAASRFVKGYFFVFLFFLAPFCDFAATSNTPKICRV